MTDQEKLKTDHARRGPVIESKIFEDWSQKIDYDRLQHLKDRLWLIDWIDQLHSEDSSNQLDD